MKEFILVLGVVLILVVGLVLCDTGLMWGVKMTEHKCKYTEDKSGDVYECNGYYTREVKCPFQYKDLNPDGSVNICECKKYEVEKW